MSLLVQSKAGDREVCHYPLPDELRVGSARLNELDPDEIDILNRRGEDIFSQVYPLDLSTK